MNTLLSTDAVARSQRLAYWTDMICNVYVQLGCDPVRPDESEDFEGSIRQPVSYTHLTLPTKA